MKTYEVSIITVGKIYVELVVATGKRKAIKIARELVTPRAVNRFERIYVREI